MRFVAPPVQSCLIKNFPLKLLSISIFLTLGQTSFAYDFSIPETPTLPTNLPDKVLNVDSSTTPNAPSGNPISGSGDWYGPTDNTITNNDVQVAIHANNRVIGGWSTDDSETVYFNRVVLKKDSRVLGIYGGYSLSGNTENNIVEVFGVTSTNGGPEVYGGYSNNKGDAIDYGAGLEFLHTVGDFVKQGEPVVRLYTKCEDPQSQLGDLTANLLWFSDKKPQAQKPIVQILSV